MMITRNIGSIEQYFSAIRDIRKAWYPTPYDPAELWFRGQRMAKWTLQPGLYREDATKVGYDDETLQVAFRSMCSVHGNANDDDWDWYYRAQHYGLPTRLLDWTEGALPALYFAIADVVYSTPRRELRSREASADEGYSETSPVVWLLDAGTLNQCSVGPDYDHLVAPGEYLDLFRPEVIAQADVTYLDGDDGVRFSNEPPIAIYPRWSNARIIAQQGLFTIHGRKQTPIDQIADPGLKLARISIGSNRLDSIWQDLTSAGVNRLSLFPEPEQIAQHIRWQYAQERQPTQDGE